MVLWTEEWWESWLDDVWVILWDYSMEIQWAQRWDVLGYLMEIGLVTMLGLQSNIDVY